MSTAVDIRVVELLCSRICHDVISPVTAINNGVELWNDMGAEVVDDAMGLIAHSAEQATRRLLYLRTAYAAAGADTGEQAAREVASGLFAGTKIDLDWPQTGVAGDLPRGGLKVLLNVLMIASESIGSGGRIRLSRSGGSLTVEASGKTAGLREGVADALDGRLPSDGLEPRTAHAFMTRRFADHFGLSLGIVPAPPDRIGFTISPR